MMHGGSSGSGASSGLASAAEVQIAIQQLSEVDYFKLLKAARRRVGGTAYSEPEDLVSAAILSPFAAACGEGGRQWPKDVAFMAFLMMTLKGLSSDSRGSAVQRKTVRVDMSPENTGDRSHDVLGAVPAAEQILLDEEESLRTQYTEDADMAAIRARFAADAEVQWIIRGILESIPASRICQLSGMTELQYATAQRRWRRGLEKLFAHRVKS